jgi:arylsulfatase A-like enzyme
MKATSDPRPARAVVLRLAKATVWLGIVTAWIELAILGHRKYIQQRPSFGFPDRVTLLADHHNFWLVPLAETATLLVPVSIVAVVALRWPRSRAELVGVALAGALAVASVLLSFTWLHPGAVLLLAIGAGVQLGRLAARTPRFHRLVDRTLAWMVALVIVTGGAAVGWERVSERWAVSGRAAAAGAPNVILIILDTVRAFNLSTYGYGRETSPNLTRIATRGVLFKRAHATAPWTLPSHASMFTGRYPGELTADLQTALDVTFPTLGEELGRRGYATAGFVANSKFAIAETGLARGFQHYEDFVLRPASLVSSSAMLRVLGLTGLVSRWLGSDRESSTKNAQRINDDFLRWQKRVDGRPYFAFLNYIDAHRPYRAPRRYALKYLESRAALQRVLQANSKTALPANASQVLRDAYDGAITYLDDRIGALVDSLERRGALENTIVLITSDHGEQFGEHGLFLHANSLYTQLLRVPLIVFGPGRIPPGVEVSTPVSLVDLASTVLDVADRGGGTPFPGRSLARYWSDDATGDSTRSNFGAELGASARRIQDFASESAGMWSVFVDGMHYIHSAASPSGSVAERDELFDTISDSLEEHDLARTEAGRQHLGRLRATLDSLLRPLSEHPLTP